MSSDTGAKINQPDSQTLMQSLVSPKIAEAISNIPKEWLHLEEEDLVKAAFGGWEKVQPVDLALRRSFWVHYSVAVGENEPMTAESAYKGICSVDTFYKILARPNRTAFMICEPQDEKLRAQHLLYIAWRNIREILEAKPGINNKTGLKDTKLMDTQVKLFQYLDQRQNGKLIERHQHHIKQETIQTNIDGGKLETHLTPQQVDKRLAELDEKLSLPPAQAHPEILDTISHNERTVYATARNVEDEKRERNKS